MDGIVIKSTGSWFTVRDDQGNVFECKIRGQFRMKGLRTTNPIAIGDKVRFQLQEKEEVGVIEHIYDRSNYIIRKATNLSKLSHIIAANLDQAIIIITLAQPRTSTGFIDRFLVTAEAYHIEAKIILNKIDLYDQKLWKSHQKIKDIYENIGYECIEISVKENTNIDQVEELLKGKVSLFTGHSGVGKSALINKIESKLNIKTGHISSVHNKGKHTTTFAEMYTLSGGGYIVDTPGIKEFGLIDFKLEEVAERFPEMRKYMLDCKFNNCTHVHEPDCAVIKAVKDKKISLSRYENYINILDDDYFKIKPY